MRPPLREWTIGRDLDREKIPSNPIDFLRDLAGPALLRLPGLDSSRTRVITTLLHANEPSGLRAIVRYLRSGQIPATDVIFFIAAVTTALRDPVLSHRALPDRPDANRVWVSPWNSPEAEVARDVLDRIRSSEPEFLVDLHNNTGHNPAYGVVFGVGAAELALVSLFAGRAVHTPIQLHTLVEATQGDFPSVTIECGRAGDPAADEAAWNGLDRVLRSDTIDLRAPARPLELLGAPVRVCLAPGFDLAFADQIDSKAAITISKDIDRHNFETLKAGMPIGWLEAKDRWPLRAIGGAEEECSRELFEADLGVLRTRRSFIPIMMTTNREIARSDCLFYAVQPLALPHEPEAPEAASGREPRRIGLLPGEKAWWR